MVTLNMSDVTSMISGWVMMNMAATARIATTPAASPPKTTTPVITSHSTVPNRPMTTPIAANPRGGRPSAARLINSPSSAMIPVGMNRPISAMKKPATPSPLLSRTGTITYGGYEAAC
jgi:hypothetical protein